MDYFVLRFDHSYRKEDFRALSKLAGKTTRKWSSRIISVFGFAVLDCLRSFPASADAVVRPGNDPI